MLKYRPGYPSKGFATLASAQEWVLKFIRWYNTEHRHSALKFVMPMQRHQGADVVVLKTRKALYEQAKKANPKRWSGDTRNWQHPEIMWLNPMRESDALQKKAA